MIKSIRAVDQRIQIIIGEPQYNIQEIRMEIASEVWDALVYIAGPNLSLNDSQAEAKDKS
jgi:hypothetical protein